jgi:hypothetical protein
MEVISTDLEDRVEDQYHLIVQANMIRLLITAVVVFSSPIPVTLIIRQYIPQKHRFLEEPQGVTPPMSAFFKYFFYG